MGAMGFLPGGFPFGGTTLGQPTPAQPNTGTMTPEQLIEWYTALANTPQGQAAATAQQQTIAMNVKIANAQLQAERDRIAIAQGQAAADRWYKEQQVALAQQAHQLAVLTQSQNYELSGAALTGMFQGNPTLANQAQTAMYTGLYNGTPTLQAQNQAQQFGLQQGQLTGTYQGAPTLQALQNAQNFGLNQAATTGYYNGNATLPREQQAANTAIQAAQLGASLRGPGDWAQYLQAMNAVAGSPASALVASAPGGLGQAAGPAPAPMSLAQMLGQFGVMPGQGPSQPAQQQAFTEPASGQMYTGGTPGFNEQTGSYSSAPAGGMRSTMPVGAGGGGTRSAFTDAGRGTMPVNPQDPNRSRVAPAAPVFADPQEQGRYMQLLSAGPGDLNPTDLDELRRFQARLTQQPAQQQGWNQYSMTGAIGQVASAPRPTNAQLGLTDDEANQLQSWFASPNQASSTWWSSKSGTQKEYLRGLGSMWGHDMNTFEERERNARPRQGAWNAA